MAPESISSRQYSKQVHASHHPCSLWADKNTERRVELRGHSHRDLNEVSCLLAHFPYTSRKEPAIPGHGPDGGGHCCGEGWDVSPDTLGLPPRPGRPAGQVLPVGPSGAAELRRC